jgi:hypothetical protein
VKEAAAWLLLFVPLTMGIIVGVSDHYESMPAWFHKTASVIRKIAKVPLHMLLYMLYAALFASVVFFVLPRLFQAGLVWLFPTSSAGYSMRYGVSQKNVFIEPKPHDCEWGKAPIGNKYCHFDKVVDTTTDGSGKTTRVYVSWQKVEE